MCRKWKMRNSKTDKTSKGLSEIHFNPYKIMNLSSLFLLLWIVWSRTGDMMVTGNQGLAAKRLSEEKIAVVLKVKGKVSIIRNNETFADCLRRGSCLENRDKLITDKNSFVVIRFIEDSDLLRIRPNSICVFKDNKVKNEVINNVYLELESILVRVIRQTPVIRVVKPTSVAAVKWVIIPYTEYVQTS